MNIKTSLPIKIENGTITVFCSGHAGHYPRQGIGGNKMPKVPIMFADESLVCPNCKKCDSIRWDPETGDLHCACGWSSEEK